MGCSLHMVSDDIQHRVGTDVRCSLSWWNTARLTVNGSSRAGTTRIRSPLGPQRCNPSILLHLLEEGAHTAKNVTVYKAFPR